MEFLETNWFNYLVLPLLIVIARIFDVSFGTLRIIYLSKGYKWLSSVLGFFEVLIWLLAITRIFSNLTNWVSYIAYPLGFSLGIFVGMRIEERIAMGQQIIRIITRKEASELLNALRNKGYSVTALKAEGSQGEVGILYSIVNRKNIDEYVDLIQEFNPNAFYSIEDVKFVSQDLKERKKHKVLINKGIDF
jgi:uncharacterized protein YebE (UPF0316 family)